MVFFKKQVNKEEEIKKKKEELAKLELAATVPDTETQKVKVESKKEEKPKEVTILDVVANMTITQYQAEILARLINIDERLKRFENESTKP